MMYGSIVCHLYRIFKWNSWWAQKQSLYDMSLVVEETDIQLKSFTMPFTSVLYLCWCSHAELIRPAHLAPWVWMGLLAPLSPSYICQHYTKVQLVLVLFVCTKADRHIWRSRFHPKRQYSTNHRAIGIISLRRPSGTPFHSQLKPGRKCYRFAPSSVRSRTRSWR